MVNQQLVDYIKNVEAQGYKTDNNQKTSIVQGIKKRNPWLVLLFSVITFGIYAMFWLVFTTNELRKNTKSAPNPWLLVLMFIPIVNIIVMFIYFWKYSKAINELTGFSTTTLFLLLVLIGPVAMPIAQIELNKKAG